MSFLTLSGASVEGVGRCVGGSRSNCNILCSFFGSKGGSEGGSGLASRGIDGERCIEGATCCSEASGLGRRWNVMVDPLTETTFILLSAAASSSATAAVSSWGSGDATASATSSSVAYSATPLCIFDREDVRLGVVASGAFFAPGRALHFGGGLRCTLGRFVGRLGEELDAAGALCF